jgi:hypothetical protein
MRKFLLLAALVPAACSTAPARTAAAAATASDGICRNDGLSRFVGQTRSDGLEAQLLAASGARLIRWVTPEMIITMDHREDRLTVRLGTDNRIGSLNCG